MDESLDKYFASVFKPGSVLLTSGFKGGGKSHTAVAIGERLVKGCYPSVGKVVMVTNMIFFHKVNDQIVEEPPPGVYHITTMMELFPLIVDIIEEHGRDVVILMVLDEAQNFVGGDSNQTNASVMMKEFLGTIRKFRLVVWFLTPSARGIGPAFRNFLNDPKYPGNLTCKLKKDLAANQRYIEANRLPYKPRELMLIKAYDSEPRFLRVPVTEWTGTLDTLVEGGYCYDHEASATFYVGDGFDWEKFNRTIGGVSSVNVLNTIRSYYAANHPDGVGSGTAPVPKPEMVRRLTQVEIAVNMLNKGMSERDVAEKVGLTRNALRYRIESAGYVRVCQQTSKGVEKCWLLSDNDNRCIQPQTDVASVGGGCLKKGGFSSPIYISRETPENHGIHGSPRTKPVPSKGTSDPSSSGDGDPCRDTSHHPSSDANEHVGDSRRIPDGRYSVDELAEAVHWCIGGGT